MNLQRLPKILLSPVVSEKGSRMADKSRQYVFKVLTNATKPEVKQAVELLFKVKVEKVRIVNIRGKARTFRQVAGRKKNCKKAYVSLAPGYDIQFADSSTA